jgi:hypothetical protein
MDVLVAASSISEQEDGETVRHEPAARMMSVEIERQHPKGERMSLAQNKSLSKRFAQN